MYVDAHCHLYAFSDDDIKKIFQELNMVVIAISDTYDASKRTQNLAKIHNNIIPCIGIHPWEIKGEDVLQAIDKLIENINDAKCIGEVGLDKRFNSENYNLQKEAFYKFVEASIKYKKPLNIHALDAWREAFEIVSSMGVKRAIFHWYSGPIDLLRKIKDSGYFITINPSVKFQKKHSMVLKESPIEIILTESDAPYNYRGLTLHPNMIPKLIDHIAKVKNLKAKYIETLIESNAERYLDWLT